MPGKLTPSDAPKRSIRDYFAPFAASKTPSLIKKRSRDENGDSTHGQQPDLVAEPTDTLPSRASKSPRLDHKRSLGTEEKSPLQTRQDISLPHSGEEKLQPSQISTLSTLTPLPSDNISSPPQPAQTSPLALRSSPARVPAQQIPAAQQNPLLTPSSPSTGRPSLDVQTNESPLSRRSTSPPTDDEPHTAGTIPPMTKPDSRTDSRHEKTIGDSDSDGDSLSSFDDLDKVLQLTKAPTSPKQVFSTPSLHNAATRPSTRSQRTRAQAPKLAPPPIFKTTAWLGGAAAGNRAAEQAYRDAKALAQRVQQREATAQMPAGTLTGLDQSIDAGQLRSLMGQEEHEDADRLMRALERTEALQVAGSWSFFAISKHKATPPPLPKLQDTVLGSLIRSPRDFDALVQSGFLRELAAKRKLPEELVTWILHMSLLEPQEGRRKAYEQIVQHAGSLGSELMTSDFLPSSLRDLDVKAEVLSVAVKVKLSACQSSSQDRLDSRWDHVCNLLRVVALLAPRLDQDVRSVALRLAIFAGIDSTNDTHAPLALAVEAALRTLIEDAPDEYFSHTACSASESSDSKGPTTIWQVLQSLQAQLQGHSQLQLRLLQAIPVTTTRLRVLRQYLAQCFLDPDTRARDIRPGSTMLSLDDFRTRLRQSADFKIDRQTFYPALTDRIRILDCAIGSGHPLSLHCLNHSAVSVDPDDGDRTPLHNTSECSSSSGQKVDATATSDLNKNAIAAFDQSVDALASSVRELSTQILDTGASHLTRTEAKEALEALYARLLYAVRSRPPARRSIFAAHDIERERGRASGFLAQYIAQKQMTPDSASVPPVSHDRLAKPIGQLTESEVTNDIVCET